MKSKVHHVLICLMDVRVLFLGFLDKPTVTASQRHIHTGERCNYGANEMEQSISDALQVAMTQTLMAKMGGEDKFAEINKSIFDAIDTDNSGTLEREEVESFVKSLLVGIHNEEEEEYEDEDGNVYYVSGASGEAQWEHPSDDIYRKLVQDYRRRLQEQEQGPTTWFRGAWQSGGVLGCPEVPARLPSPVPGLRHCQR